MAGEARSIDFLVGTATIMLGLPADLRDFRPETHSIGLVKNVKLMAEATYIELTQGIRNSVVHSIKTGEPVRASSEVYEFNAANWSYALGFSGYNIVNTELETTVTTAVAASSLGTSTFDVTATVGYVVGDYVMVQVGYDDVVIPRRITATTTGVSPTITFDAPIKNVAVSIGSKIRRCLVVPVGRKSEQPFLAAKIVGSIADGREIAIEIPNGFYGQIQGRSSLASMGIFPIGGVIDSSYRGEVKVMLHVPIEMNTTVQIGTTHKASWFPESGNKIAQLVLLPVPECEIEFVDELDMNTDRSINGFGSTGA